MSSPATPPNLRAPVAEEDQGRAGYYALLARLFYSGPDAALLASISGAPETRGEGRSELERAWDALVAAARVTDAESARLEYDDLFVGTGKAPVTPYATHYLAQTGQEKILVRLKSELAAMGLARSARANEPEDHFAALLEVMRHLISEGSTDIALQKQKAFFERYISPSCGGFCNAVISSDKARFYRYVGRFADAFFVVETEVLKMF